MQHCLRHSLVVAVAAAAVLTGCAGDTPLAPNRQPSLSAQLASRPAADVAGDETLGSVTSDDGSGIFNRAADVRGCVELQAPVGSVLSLHVFGRGVQIYRWNGASWIFVEPSAVLYADATEQGEIGTHFGGPTWKSNSGGTVVGTVDKRCTPNPDAIQWLSLTAKADGAGIFERTTFIQRLNTVGGLAPSTPGTFTGEIASVRYSADYYFYDAP